MLTKKKIISALWLFLVIVLSQNLWVTPLANLFLEKVVSSSELGKGKCKKAYFTYTGLVFSNLEFEQPYTTQRFYCTSLKLGWNLFTKNLSLCVMDPQIHIENERLQELSQKWFEAKTSSSWCGIEANFEKGCLSVYEQDSCLVEASFEGSLVKGHAQLMTSDVCQGRFFWETVNKSLVFKLEGARLPFLCKIFEDQMVNFPLYRSEGSLDVEISYDSNHSDVKGYCRLHDVLAEFENPHLSLSLARASFSFDYPQNKNAPSIYVDDFSSCHILNEQARLVTISDCQFHCLDSIGQFYLEGYFPENGQSMVSYFDCSLDVFSPKKVIEGHIFDVNARCENTGTFCVHYDDNNIHYRLKMDSFDSYHWKSIWDLVACTPVCRERKSHLSFEKCDLNLEMMIKDSEFYYVKIDDFKCNSLDFRDEILGTCHIAQLDVKGCLEQEGHFLQIHDGTFLVHSLSAESFFWPTPIEANMALSFKNQNLMIEECSVTSSRSFIKVTSCAHNHIDVHSDIACHELIGCLDKEQSLPSESYLSRMITLFGVDFDHQDCLITGEHKFYQEDSLITKGIFSLDLCLFKQLAKEGVMQGGASDQPLVKIEFPYEIAPPIGIRKGWAQIPFFTIPSWLSDPICARYPAGFHGEGAALVYCDPWGVVGFLQSKGIEGRVNKTHFRAGTHSDWGLFAYHPDKSSENLLLMHVNEGEFCLEALDWNFKKVNADLLITSEQIYIPKFSTACSEVGFKGSLFYDLSQAKEECWIRVFEAQGQTSHVVNFLQPLHLPGLEAVPHKGRASLSNNFQFVSLRDQGDVWDVALFLEGKLEDVTWDVAGSIKLDIDEVYFTTNGSQKLFCLEPFRARLYGPELGAADIHSIEVETMGWEKKQGKVHFSCDAMWFARDFMLARLAMEGENALNGFVLHLEDAKTSIHGVNIESFEALVSHPLKIDHINMRFQLDPDALWKVQELWTPCLEYYGFHPPQKLQTKSHADCSLILESDGGDVVASLNSWNFHTNWKGHEWSNEISCEDGVVKSEGVFAQKTIIIRNCQLNAFGIEGKAHGEIDLEHKIVIAHECALTLPLTSYMDPNRIGKLPHDITIKGSAELRNFSSIIPEEIFFKGKGSIYGVKGFLGEVEGEILLNRNWDLWQASSPILNIQCQNKNLTFQDVLVTEQEEKFHFKACYNLNEEPLILELETNKNFDSGLLAIVTRGQEDHCLCLWEYQDNLIIKKIQGTFLGMSIDLSPCRHHFPRYGGICLKGKVQLDGEALEKIIPEPFVSSLKKFRLGSGFLQEGVWEWGETAPYIYSFEGNVKGKECSVLGYSFNSFGTHVKMIPHKIECQDVFLKDLSGELYASHVTIQRESQEAPWLFSVPCVEVKELRPSLLKSSKHDSLVPAPLEISKLSLFHFQGVLDQQESYKGVGYVKFTNGITTPKNHIFALPIDLINKLGLDMSLLAPVGGTITFYVNEGKVWFQEFIDMYSEREHSEFVLSPHEASYMDFHGNLNVKFKMKQHNLLLKFTELFTFHIGGNLADPRFVMPAKTNVAQDPQPVPQNNEVYF